MKRLTAVTDPLLLNAIRKEISILQRVSFDRNVVQVPPLCPSALLLGDGDAFRPPLDLSLSAVKLSCQFAPSIPLQCGTHIVQLC